MNNNDLIAYIESKIEEGFTLRNISLLHNMNPSYFSNMLKKRGLLLKNIKKLKENGLNNVKGALTKNINKQQLKELILSGLTSVEIAKQMNLSWPTILKQTKEMCPYLLEKLHENGKHKKYNSAKGRPNFNWRSQKGKTYEEIFGVEKAAELRKKRSDWIKNNNIRKFAKRISKPQLMLSNIVKEYFSNVHIEYSIKLPNNRIIWLDIALPDKKICIEYDGVYWHNFNKIKKNIINDNDRDMLLKSMNWQVYRIRCEKNPNESMLRKMFLDLRFMNE